MDTDGQPSDLDDLLRRYLSHEPEAAAEFYNSANPYILNLSRKIAPELARDKQEEIAQQTFLNLWELPPSSFDPERGSAKGFLYGHVRDAARKVRADYCPPGQRTRRYRKSAGEEQQEEIPAAISLDTGTFKEPRAQNEFMRFENVLTVETIRSRATGLVAAAINLIYLEDKTMTQTATELCVSRFQLRREFNSFAQPFI
jgi:DNA-directed RNA polymerase specialized sigma24 family protein